MLHIWDWDSKELLLGTMNWHTQCRDCYYTTFCLKIKYNWDKSSGASMYGEFPEKHFYNGYICDCSFFFFLAIQRKSNLSPAQREKHLAAWGKTGLVTSAASQKERNSSLKKQDMRRISKLNKWKESILLFWWKAVKNNKPLRFGTHENIQQQAAAAWHPSPDSRWGQATTWCPAPAQPHTKDRSWMLPRCYAFSDQFLPLRI